MIKKTNMKQSAGHLISAPRPDEYRIKKTMRGGEETDSPLKILPAPLVTFITKIRTKQRRKDKPLIPEKLPAIIGPPRGPDQTPQEPPKPTVVFFSSTITGTSLAPSVWESICSIFSGEASTFTYLTS